MNDLDRAVELLAGQREIEALIYRMGYALEDGDFDTVGDVAVGRGSSSELYITQITADGPVPLVTPNPSPRNARHCLRRESRCP